MTGTIFDLQRGSFVDGPGVRTTVFLKGCNLRCAWCHNPEGWLKEQQILYYASKCSHCGRCERVCRHTAIHTPSRCVLCGACVDACLNNARELCGRNISTDELMTDLRKDDAFFQISGGGVTFSGGECMLQIDFLAEMLHLCTSEGINTAVDTAGNVPYGMFQRVMDTTNLFLYDVKCVSPELHWKFTGVDNALILENLRRLSCDHAQIWVRVPIIGGFNDNADELKRIAEFVNKCEVARVDLLPYHKMGLSKYEAVWRKTGPQFMTPDSTLLSQAASWFRNVSMNQGGKNEREKKRRSFVDWFLQKPESGVMLILIVFYIVVTCVNPRFLSTKNVINVLHASGFTLLSVTGMSLILIIGGLDLSIGSVYALAAVTSSLLMTQTGLPVWICIIVGLQLGALIGTLNGLLIVYIKIPPMIATLGTQYIARGAVTVLTHGTPIYPLPDSFVRIEEIRIFGFVPVVVPIAIVVAIVFHFILSKTVFGRSVYAIGGNGEAARISGISINKTKMSTYIIMGVLAATAGILTASRLGSAEPSTGTALEMKVICGAVIGGVSVAGGMGTILGAALGALFMESLTNALTVMRISVYWQNVVFGTVLVLSVMLDEYKRQMIKKHAMKEMKDEKASAVKE